MYRALTLEALRQGIDPGDGRRLAALARRLRFDLGPSGLLVDGRRVGRSIRAAEVSAAVSEVSAHAPVRRELVRRQRELIGSGGVVAEGRDIGTVVCPDADLKVFLTASAAERARRRHEELTDAGVRVGYAALKRDLERRDALDSNRSLSPLRPAADAHLIDSTGMSQRQVVGEVVRLACEKRPRGRRAR
jgi:cytidylate kinase